MRSTAISLSGQIYATDGSGIYRYDSAGNASLVLRDEVAFMTFDPSGNLVYSDGGSIIQVSASGGARALAGIGDFFGYPVASLGDGQNALTVQLRLIQSAAFNALGDLFLSDAVNWRVRKVHVPKIAAGLIRRILPDGTPVSLISVEDWTSKTAESGGPIAFMLAKDIQVDGVIVAPIGSKAWGHASFTGDDKTMQVGLDNVRLKIGDKDVPLRRTPVKDGGAALEYHRLENSGRISIVLYVAENVSLPPAR